MIGSRFIRLGLAAVLVAGLHSAAIGDQAEPSRNDTLLMSNRLIGNAHYENDDFKSAAAAFRRCIELAPDSASDHFNLGLALMRANQLEEALAPLQKAMELDSDLLSPHFVRGIVYKRQERFAEAIRDLEWVAERDPEAPGVFYNLGVCHKYLGQDEQARDAMKTVIRLSPNHVSAYYQLITLARRLGQVEEAKRYQEVFERIRSGVDESEKTAEALERSRYSGVLGVTPTASQYTAASPADPRFADAGHGVGLGDGKTEASPRARGARFGGRMERSAYSEAEARQRYVCDVGGALQVADYDGDGDPDIYQVRCGTDPEEAANRLYRNRGDGSFEEVSRTAGVGDPGMGTAAVFGDYDNDGFLDLYVVNYGPNKLYRGRGDGSFEDVSERSRADEPQFGRTAVFFDYDHDHDLDIFIGNDVALDETPAGGSFTFPDDFPGQVNALLRNNGDGTFSDRTDEAGLLVDRAQTRGALFADFDGDLDTDLLVVNANARSLLFTNQRMGSFDVGGSFSPPVDDGLVAAAEGDFDRDGDSDLVIATATSLRLYLNDGDLHFEGLPLALPRSLSTGVGSIAVLDHDNDGWADLLLGEIEGRGLYLMSAVGGGRFRDGRAVARLDAAGSGIAACGVGDFDGDGDQDIAVQTNGGGVRLLRNDAGRGSHWLDVRLVGRKVNRSGYAATVEISAPGFYQRQTAARSRLHFGLGALDSVAVVRVTWPNGVAQNVVKPAVDGVTVVEEYVKVSASCGFLWADGGRGFELINEILGIGPLGVPMAPGVYHQPDSTELTKIETGQLVAEKGVYELRITEELREIVFADRFTLRVIDHPAEHEIIPNEMFSAPPFPEDKFYAVSDPRPPERAIDDRGTDVRALILERDGRAPSFPLTRYDGLAAPHSLTLDLGDLSDAEEILLFLDGWIYWPDSSTVMAVAQDPHYSIEPLSLEVRDARGGWRTIIASVGLPTSKGLVVPVDLTGRFTGSDYSVRLSTTESIYFDRIFVATRDHARRSVVTELPVAHAELRYRGFSAMERDPLGYERFDYASVSPTGSWSQAEGNYTRYGRVTELLAAADDMYVIFGPGDELSLRFEATSLPDLPAGWVRDFIFFAQGWVKDGDLNTKHSHTVGPLPFHRMSAYPYPETEHYPRTPQHEQYQRSYNTRGALATVGRLALSRDRR